MTEEVTVGRKRLYTTFPRRLLEDDAFVRLDPVCQHLLYHMYAHLHPTGRAYCSALMLSKFLIPQLFPDWESHLEVLSGAGFVLVYKTSGVLFVALACYDEDQPANLIRDRPDADIPYPEPNTVLKLDINCDKTASINQTKKIKKTNKTNKSSGKKKETYTASFNAWYELYPRKDGPKGAWGPWKKAVAAGAEPEDIMAGLKAAIGAGAFSMERKWWPMAKRWLNEERWLADYSTPMSEMDSADAQSLERMKGGAR
jgi:hypothetical protein